MGNFYWPNGTLEMPHISSPFGMRKHPITGKYTMHYGTDFVGFTYNRSICGGVVTVVGTPPGWAAGGYQVWVRNDDGSLARYMHGVQGSAQVKVGQRVAAKQILSKMGMTGAATGVHLHLEIVPKGKTGQTDPVPYIKARLASSSGGGDTPFPPIPTPDPKDEDMARNSGVAYTRKADGMIVYLLFNADSGWQHEFSSGVAGKPMPGAYNNALAVALDTPSWATITEGHANVIKAGLAAVRPASAPTSFNVDIVGDADVKSAVNTPISG